MQRLRERASRCLPACGLAASLLAVPVVSPSPRQAAEPAPLDTAGVALTFARIPAGSFQMGSSNRPEEGPVHQVTVPAFDLATTEVTVRQFRAFVQATGYVTDAERAGRSFLCCWRPKLGVTWRSPGFVQSDEDPVLAVSWKDATAFCRWLARETRFDYRLPSEAEWEYAARADQAGRELGESAWYDRNSGGRSQPVGTRAAGRLGLHDVLGNAWEWVEDVYHDSYAGAPGTGRAWNEGGSQVAPGQGRVLRGGAWGLCDCRHPAGYEVTLTSRPVFGAAESCNNSGFRIARSIPPAATAAPETSAPPPRTNTTAGVETTWIALPAGRFDLGAEGPGHSRTVVFERAVLMMRDEVTVAQFRHFVQATGYRTDAEQKGWAWDSDFRTAHETRKAEGASWTRPGYEQSPGEPVTMVSWNDAQAFCRWLSGESGRNYRLPSEAEWEYACTAGGKEPAPSSLGDAAWFFDNSGARTHPVGTRQPNAWGFHDLLGNAAEWVLDAWSPDLQAKPGDGSALLGLTTEARVVRGGSYERERGEFGPRARDWHDRAEAVAGVGFRVVDATPENVLPH